ncbi:hypothetical protein HPB48_017521 [Haemaphysalis longicornis]|uniref:THAP-type domain-containing protein n=1 Tax=Haemaphysalis longicornis TaxID=44386 RepID=A0A9J6GVY9_HAELO|nr:hypothetical protein HPB48_017521 [Haemaphysalis longicornis]
MPTITNQIYKWITRTQENYEVGQCAYQPDMRYASFERSVGCVNRRSKESNIGFFRFPSQNLQALRRKRWTKALNRFNDDGTQWEPTNASRICGDHFYTEATLALLDMPSSCEVDGLRKELKATQAALELSTGREAALKRELEETQAPMRRAEERLALWQLYCASMEDRQLTVKVLTGLSECYFYTGLPSYSVFEGLYKY